MKVPHCKKIQINSVLPAEHSLCPALLGALCPTEGLWSPLSMRDEEGNSSIVLFSIFKSIGPKELSTCVCPSIWRTGMRFSLKGRKVEEKGEQKMHTGTCLKNSSREDNLSRLVEVFPHFALSSLLFTPTTPTKTPPLTPQLEIGKERMCPLPKAALPGCVSLGGREDRQARYFSVVVGNRCKINQNKPFLE